MGAPARIWRDRLVLVLAITAGVLLLRALGLPLGVELAVLGVGLAVAAVLIFRLVPAFDPLGRVRWRVPAGGRKVCAVTFDDGPTAGTAGVLDALAAAGVKATFFVLAGNARRHPELLRRIAAEGHTVAVHGNTHRKLHRADDGEVQAELQAALASLRDLGVEPAPLYRTPHGVKCGAVFRTARRLGLELWAWSRGVWDTDRPPPEVLVQRATRLARPGMVLLLHDGRGDEERPDIGAMVAALPAILAGLRGAGFSFVTLDRPAVPS
jgi:peptidoglycan/xylan/chitin deacetylase (PgdA/CDA1 family)